MALEKKFDFGALHDQRNSNTCGVGSARTVLDGCFGIEISEEDLIYDVEKRYREKNLPKDRRKDYKILKNGMGEYHFRILAEINGLDFFSSSSGNLKTVLKLLDNKLWPVIHRSFEPGGEYKEGHYVVPVSYFKDERRILVFDPAQGGAVLDESFNQFKKNWVFSDAPNHKDLYIIYKKPLPFKLKIKDDFVFEEKLYNGF